MNTGTKVGGRWTVQTLVLSSSAFVGMVAVWILRHLPTVGGCLGGLAVILSIIGSSQDSLQGGAPWTWDHWIHRVGTVIALNTEYEGHNSWTHFAQAFAVIAAGILGLEIFRFLAGSAYNWVRRLLRRWVSGPLMQRRVMVIGFMPEAHWMAEQIARVAAVGRMSPPYQVSHVRVNSDVTSDRAAPLGGLMSIDVPRLDTASLQRAGLAYSDEVLLFGDGDARALELLAATISVKDHRWRPRTPRVVRVRIDSPDVAELVRQANWGSPASDDSANPPVDIRVISADDIAARQAFALQQLDWRHSFGKPGGSTELICLGFGDSQRAFALEMLRRAHHIDEARMSIVAIDLEVEQAVARLRASFPEIDRVASIRCIAADAFSAEAHHVISASAEDTNANLSIAVSVGDVDRNLEIALGLPKTVRSIPHGTPSPMVFVRQSLIADVSTILGRFAKIRSNGLIQLHPWGGLHNSYDPSIVLEGALDTRAKQIHATYLRNYPPRLEDARDPLSSRRMWQHLSQFKREDIRNSADFLAARLRVIGLRFASPEECRSISKDSFVEPASIGPVEREILSRLEHRRWVVMRSLSGWTRGSEFSYAARMHPSVCPWSELSEVERKKEDIVAAIEAALLPGEQLVRVAVA